MRAAVLAAALLLAGTASAKHVRGRFQLDAGDIDHGPEVEISKFSFLVGTSKIRGKISFAQKDSNWMTSPALYLFSDDRWDEYHKAPACMDKVEFAHEVIRIGDTTDNSMKLQRSDRNYGYRKLSKDVTASVTVNEGIVDWNFEWKVTHSERTKGWILIVADCALEQYNYKVAPMQYSVEMLNPGDSHLPADEDWLPTMYLLVLVAMVAHALLSVRVQLEQIPKVHLVVKLLGAAYACQLLSTFLELCHLFIYTTNGRGVFVADFTSEVLEGFSSLVICFVLICLACGWTLVEDDGSAKKSMSVAYMFRNPKSMLKSGNILGNVMVLFILALVVWFMLLTFWNKLGDDELTKFHDVDTVYGARLIQIRMGLFAFFGGSLFYTLFKQRQRAGSPVLTSFLLKLLVLGSLWFVTFPLMVLVANMSVHYIRHRLVVIGTITGQTVCLAALCHQFLSQSSTYARLSTAWESGMLPGAGGIFTGSKGAARD